MSIAELRNIRLTAFKSFRGAAFPVSKLTVLTGRNSSGKSNALDGIEVLSRLAGGEDLADALDGRRREGGTVRGGSRGCAPHGLNYFDLGCSVVLRRNVYHFDVRVQVEPELRILREVLRGPGPALESGLVDQRYLLWTKPAGDQNAGLWAEVHNGKRGVNPVVHFRDNRLLITQVPARLVPKNDADEAVVRGAQAVVAALRGVFHFDPVPHLMRDYAAVRDADLRRTGENLSAAIARLASLDEKTFKRLVHLVQEVADEGISGIEVTPSALGDVMLALREGNRDHQITPAREMSDGLLRFMAIATALLTANRGLDIDSGLASQGEISSGILLVVEELENGLHPSQAARVLSLIRETAEKKGTRVAVTTHSPALLNAFPGHLNRNVLVCYRNRQSGSSELLRLTDLPGYAESMAIGRLGDVVTDGRLVRPEVVADDYSDFNRLLGIE
ncbi:ATP-binding protein [Micromonospora chalcea]|uniref:AAA family ATPase n=1 Tax=Micromonospora chalcea TaxID=1874 RepID=UPI0033D51673